MISFESQLEDVAQLTGKIDYSDAKKLNDRASYDSRFHKKLASLVHKYQDAESEGDLDQMNAVGDDMAALSKKLDDEKPVAGKTYRCTRTFTHENLGRMLTKGKLYECVGHNLPNSIQMHSEHDGGVNCDLAFFVMHFEDAASPVEKTITAKFTGEEAAYLKAISATIKSNREKFDFTLSPLFDSLSSKIDKIKYK